MDYRNTSNSKNKIIYAYGSVNGSMFGTLKNIVKDNWFKNTDNHIVKLSTETENTLWQVFSAYHIGVTNYYLAVDFSSDKQYNDFLQKLINRSIYDFKTTVSSIDKILTLSTCYNNAERVALHAKLIKRIAR